MTPHHGGRNRKTWEVIIARDRPDLWVTWASFYGGAETVEVLIDRRQGRSWVGKGHRPDRRAQPNPDGDLQKRGFLVIRRPEIVGTPPALSDG